MFGAVRNEPRYAPRYDLIPSIGAASATSSANIVGYVDMDIVIFGDEPAGRPGPAHHMATRPKKHGLYMGRPDNYVGRPVCCPVVKGASAYADVIL